jgi:hypothetical protein
VAFCNAILLALQDELLDLHAKGVVYRIIQLMRAA